jgi:hypothetical protein
LSYFQKNGEPDYYGVLDLDHAACTPMATAPTSDKQEQNAFAEPKSRPLHQERGQDQKLLAQELVA